MRRILFGITVLMALMVLACAVPLDSLNSGTVSGYVFSNNPKVTVEDLVVEVRDTAGTKLASGKTDKRGYYLITGLPQGDLRVVITGITGASGTASSFGVNVTVRSGRIVQVPRINLDAQAAEKGFTIRGKVTDQDGSPIYKAVIKDVSDSTEDGASTSSLANGTFVLSLSEFSEAQTRKLEASSAGASQQLTLSYFSASEPVEFKLSLKPLVVTGVVVDQNNLPIVDAKVMDITEGGGVSATTGTDGSFSLELSNLSNGRTLEVSKGGLATTTSVSETKRTNLRITLTTSPTTRSLSGKVIDSTNDAALVGIEVKAGDSGVAAFTNNNGEFTLKGLSFETIGLTFTGTTGYGDKSYYVDPGTSSLTGQTYELDPFGTVILNYYLENQFVTGSFSGGVRAQDNLHYTDLSLVGYVAIEGTNKSQSVTYPATPTKAVNDANGDQVGTVHEANSIETLIFQEVAGGNRTVSVTLSGKGQETANVNVVAGQTTVVDVPFPSNVNTGPVTITGKVLDQNGVAVVGATVTDVTEGIGVSTLTIAGGDFSLTLPSLGSSRTLEITNGVLTTTTTVSSSNTSNIVVTLIANARTLTGYINDATTSNLFLNGASVKISGTNTSYTSKNDGLQDGYFELRGAPVTALTIDVELTGYGKTSLQVVAGIVTPQAVGNISLTPTGNLRVNMHLENKWQVNGYPGPTSYGYCTGTFFDNCGQGVPGSPWENCEAAKGAGTVQACAVSNRIVWLNDIEGFVSLEGTTYYETFSYSKTPTEDVKVVGPTGEEVTIGIRYTDNWIFTQTFTDVPGGQRSVAVGLTGSDIQRGINVFIPAGGTAATEMILVKNATSHITVGDIVGVVGGIQAADLPNVRINYVGPNEFLDMNTNLRDFLEDGFGGDTILRAPVTVDVAGNYRLQSVPTGTRMVIVGVDSGGGNFNGTYLPNTATVLSVQTGADNRAPDITLVER